MTINILPNITIRTLTAPPAYRHRKEPLKTLHATRRIIPIATFILCIRLQMQSARSGLEQLCCIYKGMRVGKLFSSPLKEGPVLITKLLKN